MTWVIGTNLIFGYAAAISDIRVTFTDSSGQRQERDCLQKIYPVGQYLAAGFAGSVKIGFEMIRSLQKGLRVDNPDLAWDPTVIAETWPDTARKICQKHESLAQAGGSQLLLLGAHPTENVGMPGVMRTYVYSFSWPGCEPIQAQPHEVLSIGSGTGVRPYREMLQRYLTDVHWRTMLMHGESIPGGTASMLASSVTKVIQDNPRPGISPHLHLCLVRAGEVNVWTNNHAHKGPWKAFFLGPPSVNPPGDLDDMERFAMPKVATTYDELEQMLSSEAATAIA